MVEQKLKIVELHKSYGSHEVLKGVSLQANKGDVISIIGSFRVREKHFFYVALIFLKNQVKDLLLLIIKTYPWCVIKTGNSR